MISTNEKIEIMLKRQGMNKKELAEKLGIKQPTLTGKFKYGDWRESDLRQIAKICGCEYEVHFKSKDWEI